MINGDEGTGSVVGMEVGLRAGRSGARFHVGTRDLSVLPNVPTGSGAYPASRSIGTVVLSHS